MALALFELVHGLIYWLLQCTAKIFIIINLIIKAGLVCWGRNRVMWVFYHLSLVCLWSFSIFIILCGRFWALMLFVVMLIGFILSHWLWFSKSIFRVSCSSIRANPLKLIDGRQDMSICISQIYPYLKKKWIRSQSYARIVCSQQLSGYYWYFRGCFHFLINLKVFTISTKKK